MLGVRSVAASRSVPPTLGMPFIDGLTDQVANQLRKHPIFSTILSCYLHCCSLRIHSVMQSSMLLSTSVTLPDVMSSTLVDIDLQLPTYRGLVPSTRLHPF